VDLIEELEGGWVTITRTEDFFFQRQTQRRTSTGRVASKSLGGNMAVR
jgi:hypothetical protein